MAAALGAVVGVDHNFAGGVSVAVGDCDAECSGDQRCVLAVVDRPAHDASEERVAHDEAMGLALTGGVLGDVGGPQPVRSGSARAKSRSVPVTTRGTSLRRLGPGSPWILALYISISIAFGRP